MPRRYREARERARAADAGTPRRALPPAEPRFTAAALPGIRMTPRLPTQDNAVDCGLFLLAYLQAFAEANPCAIELQGGGVAGRLNVAWAG